MGWTIPKAGPLHKNFIIENGENVVMGLLDNNINVGSEVVLKVIPDDLISRKLVHWEVNLATKGWFRITHSTSKGYLTAKSSTKLTIEG